MFKTHSKLLLLREFEDIACNLLNSIDNGNQNIVNYVILFDQLPQFKRTCIELAFKIKAFKFIACSAVKSLLDEIWHGNLRPAINGWHKFKVI